MFIINGTAIIFVISFLVFVYLLNKLLLQPVGAAISKRNRLIEEQHQAAANVAMKQVNC